MLQFHRGKAPFRHQRDANVESMVLKKLLIFFRAHPCFHQQFCKLFIPIILWGFEHEIDAAVIPLVRELSKVNLLVWED